jgi:hypothetical protein
MYRPQIGETVWVLWWLGDGSYDIEEGCVSGYYAVTDVYVIDGEEGEYCLDADMLYRTRQDALRDLLQRKMDDMTRLQREIRQLEDELDACEVDAK